MRGMWNWKWNPVSRIYAVSHVLFFRWFWWYVLSHHGVGGIFRWLHPGRFTWNLQITHLGRKMIFQTSMRTCSMLIFRWLYAANFHFLVFPHGGVVPHCQSSSMPFPRPLGNEHGSLSPMRADSPWELPETLDLRVKRLRWNMCRNLRP